MELSQLWFVLVICPCIQHLVTGQEEESPPTLEDELANQRVLIDHAETLLAEVWQDVEHIIDGTTEIPSLR